MSQPSIGRRLAGRFRHLRRLSWRDRWLYLQTFVLLAVARAAILTVGFERLERLMGERERESPHTLADGEREAAQRVRRALRRISPHTPWDSNCFPQALVGAVLLRRRGVEPTVYLGARVSDAAGLEAHAWLRAGSIHVSGGDGSSYGQLIGYSRFVEAT